MKTLTTICLVLTCLSGSSQVRLSDETHLITWERVITVDTMRAPQLYDRTRSWFTEYFRSAKDVVRGEDRPALIKGTFVSSYSAGISSQDYDVDITVRIKDGAVKVVLDRFRTTAGYAIEMTAVKSDGTIRTGKMYQKTLSDIDAQAEAMVASLTKFLSKTSASW